MKIVKELILGTSILHFLMEPLQMISKKLSCQESKNLTKINLQISSDEPNVNLKFLILIAERRGTEELSPLLDIETWKTAYSPQQSKIRNQII